VVVVGVVLIEYELALALPGHVTVMLVRPAMVMLAIDATAAAGVMYDTELTLPPVPVGTIDSTVNRYGIPPVRPVNVRDVPLVVWVVVAGVDVTLYDVAPKPAVHDRGMLVPETDPITKLDGAADVYAFPDVTGDAYAIRNITTNCEQRCHHPRHLFVKQ
jgi:hypothetical protein